MSIAHTRINADVSTTPKCQQNTRQDVLKKTWHSPGEFWPYPTLLDPHCQVHGRESRPVPGGAAAKTACRGCSPVTQNYSSNLRDNSWNTDYYIRNKKDFKEKKLTWSAALLLPGTQIPETFHSNKVTLALSKEKDLSLMQQPQRSSRYLSRLNIKLIWRFLPLPELPFTFFLFINRDKTQILCLEVYLMCFASSV